LWHQLQLLQQLPKLSELQLAGYLPTAAGITPLSNLQHLQHFTLRLQDRSADHPAIVQELPAALQRLTQLQRLELNYCELPIMRPQEGSLQCFSALTASTQLTSLSITDCGMPVPKAAFDHMFPPGHVLPNLRVLHLESSINQSMLHL
jgi:hypothetical protein